jgi:NAD+ synthase
MRLTQERLDIDPHDTQRKITRFIQDYVNKAKSKGIVLGVSGGVDSATTAALATKALGPNKVLGVYMPEEETYTKTDQKHVEHLAETFQFRLQTVDLTEPLSTLYKAVPDYEPQDKLSRGNFKARMRMLVLYYYANHRNLIVAASSDKSETMIGYFTKWGDAAADIAPIMDLYKTQVQQLARHLGVPPVIVKKPPTPGLWPNQSAEDEIGLSYKTLDLILFGLERFMAAKTIAKELNIALETVKTIKKRWLQAEHKRKMPLTTKLAYRTILHDFRVARTVNLE